MKPTFGLHGIAALCLMAVAFAFTCFAPTALAQGGTTEFTLQPGSFDPDAVAPGGVSSSLIQVGSVNGFTGTVNLSCQVTSQQVATDPPVCTVSPASVTAPGNATATLTTKSDTSTQPYNLTITGTGPTTAYTTPAIPLTVLAVSPQFTISVTSAVAPTSVPAGSGAQAVVTVNPVYGYVTPTKGGITLSCASMTPLVTIAPVCSFVYPQNALSLPVTGTPANATLTISTFGPITTGARSRNLMGFWFSLPLIGLVGFGAAASGKRLRGAWGMLAVIVLGGAFILIPGCANNRTSTTTPNGVTPANTYSFTIVGVDSNGVVSSNTTTSTSGPTVTLTVTAPPKTP
ncbi:MAG TPA: hypothetical protein VJP02_26495 [Candidatus Sulfotelmatobacter sp.]|nr:hypothetical protein [Candidatus Sulfotelmatobacter sp.]